MSSSPKYTFNTTRTLWRATQNDGRRMTVKLAAIELMSFRPSETWKGPNGPCMSDAEWEVIFASGVGTGLPRKLDQEAGDSLHAAWIESLSA